MQVSAAKRFLGVIPPPREPCITVCMLAALWISYGKIFKSCYRKYELKKNNNNKNASLPITESWHSCKNCCLHRLRPSLRDASLRHAMHTTFMVSLTCSVCVCVRGGRGCSGPRTTESDGNRTRGSQGRAFQSLPSSPPLYVGIVPSNLTQDVLPLFS